jgi:hypothetical protein
MSAAPAEALDLAVKTNSVIADTITIAAAQVLDRIRPGSPRSNAEVI